MDPDFASAEDVSEYVLEITRTAYLERDAELFCSRFQLPQLVGTFKGNRVLETPNQLKSVFWDMCNIFTNQGVLDFKRKTLAASFKNPNYIQRTFVTQYILPGFALSDEIFGHGYLVRENNVWLIAESTYATKIESVARVLGPRENAVQDQSVSASM
ncbi:MAG: hypothetical protein MK098_14435 [Marinovum sp.]|nr:hypothetical protein [Marinovum sp.]